MNTPLELAHGLQHSNIKEVADVCKAYIALQAEYEELEVAYCRAYASHKPIDSGEFRNFITKRDGKFI